MSVEHPKPKVRGMAAGSSLRTRRHLLDKMRTYSESDSYDSSESSSDDLSSDEEVDSSKSSKSKFETGKDLKRNASTAGKQSKQKSRKTAKGKDTDGHESTLAAFRDILDKLSAHEPKQPQEDPQLDLPASDTTGPAHDHTSTLSKALIQALEKVVEVDKDEQKSTAQPGSRAEFVRIDQLWNRKQHKWEFKPSADVDAERGEWDSYAFNVRREFSSEGKFLLTHVDVKSKALRYCLRKVIGDFPAINLYPDCPDVLADQLFWFLEEFRDFKKSLKEQIKASNDKHFKRATKEKAQHLSLLIKYLDEDYDETKKAVYPMLEAGMITFQYLWVLFKPNTIGFGDTYRDSTVPRAFRISGSTEKHNDKCGTWRQVEGRCVNYDGTSFGTSKVQLAIMKFDGSQKISSLPTYPLKYHNDAAAITSQLIQRGKSFVALQGRHYKSYTGMTYRWKDDEVLKFDVKGRIMIDPATFRRVDANYRFPSVIKDLDEDGIGSYEEDSEDTSSESLGQWTPASEQSQGQKRFKVIKDCEDEYRIVEVDLGDEINNTQVGIQDKLERPQIFSEEELLITSPVVLGFSFNDKLWVEFDVSKIAEVEWNEGAFESLILPASQKSIIKALVSSHVFHQSRSIDDVIAGKGKGLVAVLHGHPGTGKTLTLEAISDFLRRPLYMVSAGELGVDAGIVEVRLQKILDVAHSWGAILLLDEADIFLEARSTHEIQRNALVSVFLRLLEYFQGILFLTTNRVQVFDEAFVSRIHLSLRYGDLSTQAKKTVWKSFISKVQTSEGMDVAAIGDSEYESLARRKINGRQIKNVVRAAQALAIHENKAMSITHIKTVLDVAQTFENDLKGGTGYEDAMRSYT